MAVNRSVEGKQYRTIVWATNLGSSPAKVEVRYIPSSSDGTQNPDDLVDTVYVGAGLSQPLTAAYGESGILEVRSNGDVRYLGEVHSFTAGGQEMSAASVPVIDATNLVAAGDTAQLLAVERQPASSETDLGLVNLGRAESACMIRVFRPDGSQILGTATVAVAPLKAAAPSRTRSAFWASRRSTAPASR